MSDPDATTDGEAKSGEAKASEPTQEAGATSGRQQHSGDRHTPGYQTTIGGTVKQVDSSTRVVTGYYASFGTVDAEREEFAPGAFEDTIRRRGPDGSNRIKHLWQHDPFTPIGTPEVLREDERGLYFETRIVDTQAGTDALKLYEEGVINEHSVGFNRVDQEPREDGTTLITEVQLWEGSSVTWGANPRTPATGLKGAFASDAFASDADASASCRASDVAASSGQVFTIEALAQKQQAMRKVLARGLSDEMVGAIEIGMKQVEEQLRLLEASGQ
jgi:HK97 family phage prohead protease